jgi:hypothetical protein
MRIVRYSRKGEVGFGILEDEHVAAISPHPFAAFEYTGERFLTEEARLLAPVLPTKVVAVGSDFRRCTSSPRLDGCTLPPRRETSETSPIDLTML